MRIWWSSAQHGPECACKQSVQRVHCTGNGRNASQRNLSSDKKYRTKGFLNKKVICFKIIFFYRRIILLFRNLIKKVFHVL